MYTLAPPSYRCFISNLALVGQVVSEKKTFEYYGDIPGGSLKFSVYIGEADFFGVKILNFRIFLGFQKN